MSATLSSLRAQIRDLVGDNSSTEFSDTQINDSVNFAIMFMLKRSQKSYTEASATSDAAGKITVPADSMEEVSILRGTTILDRTSREWMDLYKQTWRVDSGTATKWFPLDGGSLQVTPKETYSFTLGYLKKPTDLSADGDLVPSTIGPDKERYLKYAAAAWLFQLDGEGQDLQKADSFIQKFESLVGKGVS